MATGSLHINRDIILAMKRQHMKERQAKNPKESVHALAQLQPYPRPLLNVVEEQRTYLIGQVNRTRIYDPVTASLTLVREGADAVSFFTDHAIYHQDFEDAFLVARGLRHVPLIFQNYVFNLYGVTASRVADASALVLYASLLPQDTLRELVSNAQRWRMSIIIQANSPEELSLANQLSPHAIAYGDTEKSNLETLWRELPDIRRETPKHTKLMLINCLETVDDVAQAVAFGLNAVIVSATLLEGDSAQQVRQLVGKSN